MGRRGSVLSASTAVMIAAYELKKASNWWDQIDESPLWQDRIYHILAALFGIVSFVALIWALQDGITVIIGGKLLEQKAEFPEETNSLLDRLPEIVEASRSKEPDKVSGMIDAILNFEVKQRGGLNTITI